MSDDQSRGSGLDDVFGDGREFVDAHDTIDLNEEAVEQTEITAGETRDSGGRLGIGEVVNVGLLAEASNVG